MFEHEAASTSVTALAVTSTGGLVVADRSGRLDVRTVPGHAPYGTLPSDATAARVSVEEFLVATTALPDDADLETALVRHAGQRAWTSDDLAQATHAQDDDPTWLRPIRRCLGIPYAPRGPGRSRPASVADR